MAAGGYNGKSPFPSDPGYECTNGYYRNNIDTTQYRLGNYFKDIIINSKLIYIKPIYTNLSSNLSCFFVV